MITEYNNEGESDDGEGDDGEGDDGEGDDGEGDDGEGDDGEGNDGDDGEGNDGEGDEDEGAHPVVGEHPADKAIFLRAGTWSRPCIGAEPRRSPKTFSVKTEGLKLYERGRVVAEWWAERDFDQGAHERAERQALAVLERATTFDVETIAQAIDQAIHEPASVRFDEA